jgi:hypothetical protein
MNYTVQKFTRVAMGSNNLAVATVLDTLPASSV